MNDRYENVIRDANNFLGNAENTENYKKYVMDGECPVHASEEVDVTVPVSVRAHSEIGRVSLCCLGSCITKDCDEISGSCGVSKFTLKQRLRVEIPLKCDVEAYVGEGHIHFDLLEKPCDCKK